MIGRIFRKTVGTISSLWFDDGSGAINTPWDDGDTWGEGTPVPWTPSAIATTTWHDASDLSTITEASGSVSQFNDKSGNLVHLYQSSGASQPTTGSRTLNGLNILDFDGGTEYMSALSNVPITSNMHVFAVSSRDVGGGNMRIVGTWDNGNGGWLLSPSNSASRAIVKIGGSLELATKADTSLTPIISEFEYDGTTLNATINGVRGTGTNVSFISHVNTTPFSMGADSGGASPLDGTIAEVIIVDYALSQATIDKAQGYLAWKWGLVSDLDVGHPYKSVPPMV